MKPVTELLVAREAAERCYDCITAWACEVDWSRMTPESLEAHRAAMTAIKFMRQESKAVDTIADSDSCARGFLALVRKRINQARSTLICFGRKAKL